MELRIEGVVDLLLLLLLSPVVAIDGIVTVDWIASSCFAVTKVLPSL